MAELAHLGLDFGCGNRPVTSRRFHQHHAQGGARFAVTLPGRSHRCRTTRALGRPAPGKIAVGGHVARPALDVDRFPVSAKLFVHQRGDAEIGTLAHFKLR